MIAIIIVIINGNLDCVVNRYVGFKSAATRKMCILNEPF